MRYKITLSYNGLELNGWQRQDNAPSVQEELSRALSILAGCEVGVTGAGRTDARVNAVNYVAHFDATLPEAYAAQISAASPDGCASGSNAPFDSAKISCKLNAILPKNIVVHEITPVDESFHARFSALSREYKYFIHKVKDPFVADFSYYRFEPLDVEKMNRACAALLGTHDFRCFEKTGSDNKTSVCTVYEAVWETYRPAHVSILGYPYREGDYLVFRIRADRFLRNMVRAIVGSLL
ncbi:MAG: tRNA pseudouridine(38-40) synthase TruA, partial [Bacteroidales bacterium]|nr:tRNA pseudouridine(38-40) synthase TruA [Bacteroidales bacterium]